MKEDNRSLKDIYVYNPYVNTHVLKNKCSFTLYNYFIFSAKL